MKITEIECVEPIKKLKNPHLPYQYDLNIYRGCSHDCKYCYARASHKYLDGEFESDIYVKTNIAKKLDEVLSNPSWDGSRINIGGVCDSYQHAEKKYKITREVLKVLIKHKNPFTLSTKSDLIIRDLDILKEAAGKFDFNIAICISCVDDKLSKVLEKGASSPKDRLAALKALSDIGVTTGLHVMPIIPILADDEETIKTLVKWAKESGASYLMTGTLYLSGGIKKEYFKFLEDNYPELIDKYKELYPKGGASKEYKTKIHSIFAKYRKEYCVKTWYELIKEHGIT